MSTVWDTDPDLGTPRHDPVSGKVEPSTGGLLGGFNLGVFADLALQIGSLVSRIDKQQHERDKHLRTIPGDYQYAFAATYPSSGNLLLPLGSPDQGTFWMVRRLIIGGSDTSTTPAGTGWVSVQGSPPNQTGSNINLANVADWTTGTLPQRAFYGTHQLVVDESEYLYVVITGGTNGTQYVASVKCETFDRSLISSLGWSE